MPSQQTFAASTGVGERDQFGKYEILRRLAIGGMAEIYLARALGIAGFEKLVVLKRILPQYADSPSFVDMFLDEARLAANLHHANIVQVYDVGSVDGHYFLAMEFLHGQDLRQICKRQSEHGPVPLDAATTIMTGILAGLHYAHERSLDGKLINLIHRDVSLANVFVTYDGGVKLLDFGIARASTRMAETRSGTLKGKVAYMAPEQLSGEEMDRRADVYAASVVLWELTTGRRLYRDMSEFEIMRRVKESDAPAPSTVVPDYPRALERVVLRGLARKLDDRYPSAEAMQLDLEEFARTAHLSLSSINLSRYVSELFRDRIEAWEHDPLWQSKSGDLSRTQPSLQGPATDPDARAPRTSPWLWAMLAVGVVAGSLVTWMLARRSPSPPPQRAAATIERVSPAAPPALPAPPVLTVTHERAAAAPAAPRETSKKAPKAAPPAHRKPKKPSGPEAGWDPESLLPP